MNREPTTRRRTASWNDYPVVIARQEQEEDTAEQHQEFSIAPDNRFVDFLVNHPSTNYPLPDFNTINFGPAHWTDSNGNAQPIDSSEAGVETMQETMHDPSGGSACPSDISDDSNGESYFNVAKC